MPTIHLLEPTSSSPTTTQQDRSLYPQGELTTSMPLNSKREPTSRHRKDADDAMLAFENPSANSVVLDDATKRRLLRKIDRRILPMLCLVYGLNFLDKTTLSYASVMGFKHDTNLEGDDYQWVASMFYFGYLIWEYPTVRLLQRLPLAKYSSFCIISWGLVLCCMAPTKTYSGVLAVRFFLGMFEAAVTPGFALLTSQWYSKQEQGSRTSLWFSFNGFAAIFGSLLAYGTSRGVQVHGASIAAWKIFFLVTGLLTVSIGCLFALLMPDNQLNARWLSREDRRLAIERVRGNQQGIGNKHFKMYQLKEALLDPLTWAFVLFSVASNIPNGGIRNFLHQIIVSFGYTAEESLLYGTPGGAVQVFGLIFCGFLGDRTRNRILVSCSGLIVAIIGMLLIVALPLSNRHGRLAGCYVLNMNPTAFVALLSLISSNVAGYTKKTTVAALYLISYCAGNIIGPQTFRPRDAPLYRPAEIIIICCWGVCIMDLLFIRWCYKQRNQVKAALRDRPGYAKVETSEWLDLRDIENPEFQYSL